MKRKTVLQLMFIISIFISVFFAFGVYLWVMNNKQEIIVPIVAKEVDESHRILKSDVTYVKINPNAVSPKMVTNEFDIIGNWSLRSIKPGEYFYADWISTNYSKRLADRVIYGGVPVPTSQMLSVNGEIKPDDFVMITIVTSSEENVISTNVMGVPSKKVKLIEPPELSAVRVLGLVDGSGIEIDDKKSALVEADGSISPDTALPQGSILIFDCNEIQRAMLLQASYSGTIQLIILPEAEQMAHRLAWGLIDNDGEDDVPIQVSNTTQMTPEELEERRKEITEDSLSNIEKQIEEAAALQGIELSPVEQKDKATGEQSDERG